MRGNVFANDVKVKNDGMLFGDIQCFYLTLDPTASIKVLACSHACVRACVCVAVVCVAVVCAVFVFRFVVWTSI